MENTETRQRNMGRTPYLIPYGGSNPTGASGYVAAVEELAQQITERRLPPFDRIVFASSSGGTHAGLALGAAALNLPTQILGISIDKPEVELTNEIVGTLATQTAQYLGLPHTFNGENIFANDGYMGLGYGIMGDSEMEAIRLFARTEGILLDPVYTGRAAAGLLDLIRRGDIAATERILFWHTGGFPALFAPRYAAKLAKI